MVRADCRVHILIELNAFISALLADRFRLRPRFPRFPGHRVDDPQLGFRYHDPARGHGRTREHLSTAQSDDAREPEQELCAVYY